MNLSKTTKRQPSKVYVIKRTWTDRYGNPDKYIPEDYLSTATPNGSNLRWTRELYEAMHWNTKSEALKWYKLCYDRPYFDNTEVNLIQVPRSETDISNDTRPRCSDCGKILTPEEIKEYGDTCTRCHDFWANH